MTANRRIFLNIVATYGRSLVAMMCGIFTSRWVIEGLGVEAYGVYGVIGVVISCVTFFNAMLASSVSRFFAYSEGETLAAQDKGVAIEKAREWFNVAVLIHTVFPLALVSIGAPIGIWAVRHYFNIPSHLVGTTCFVLYFSLLAAFVSMFGAPFRALFVAKQMIAELTIFDLLATVGNFLFGFSLLYYKGDRLLYHGFYSMLIIVLPLACIIIRAFCVFPECRIVPRKMILWDKLREIFSFAGWQLFSWTGNLIRCQGVTTMVNKVLGVEYNSTMNVANTVSGHAANMANSLQGAFAPAITNAAGSGDIKKMLSLTMQTCKFGTALTAIFVIPLVLEIHYVINLWLKVVPPEIEGLCVVTLVSLVLSRTTGGICGALFAIGRIREHEVLNGVLLILTLVYAWILCVVNDFGILGFGWAMLLGNASTEVMRLCLWKSILKQSIWPWFREFFIPLSIVAGVSLLLGYLVKSALSETFLRLVLVTGVAVIAFSIGCLRFLLNAEERAFVLRKFPRFGRRTK